MSLPVIVEKVLEARSLPLHTVTVFRDRAELKRVFEVQLHAGFNNVVINNVCASIEPDSIRVEGKGKAVIHEVQFKFDHATDTETDSPQVKKLVNDLNEIELQKATIDDLTKVYNNRLKSLDDLVTNLGQVTLTKKDAPEMLRFDSGVEETLENFYGYHERKAVELNSKVRKSELESRELEQKIQKLRNQVQELRLDQNLKRSICIALETVEDQSVAEIELTYQVYNASWTPSYDIRVSTIGSSPQLKLSYYGQIVQNCGEDWNEVELVLSTAQPHSGSQLPVLGSLQAQFHKPQPPRTFGAPMMKRNVHALHALQYDAAEPEMMACSVPQYVPENHALSTTFTVKQKKTIPSDGSEHKVTIVTFDLTPILHYNCVPSKSTNVYLTASMINSSSYPLINGTASVYVDNINQQRSFPVDIKTVSTGEKFDCSLGIDPTVKVTYKPVHKYQQQVGVLSKTSVTMNEQKIVIKNTKQDEPIVLTIYEHVPKSTDEKIKIKLHAPEVKSNGGSSDDHQLRAPEVGTRLNDAHNLEWTVSLTPMEEREFVVKYSVEHPPTETVEYVEQF
ncbi:Protein F37C4.5 [Aphelenchoides besseyi]|nr:Protein F37C4.5 [Aphelenchoides besseyi]